jgi:bifunctional non-homologous end joining protein LigD
LWLEKLTKVEFSNLDKVLYPEAKVTKAQVIQHYVEMAPKMLDFLKNRPIVLTRYPNGVQKEGFYEKDMPMGTPSWVKTFRKHSESAHRTLNYVVCNDLDTLLWLANLAAIELHVTLAQIDNFDRPDFLFFDIDPQPPVNMDAIVDAALMLKKRLDGLHLKSYVKTTGKRGLHVLVPIIRDYSYAQARGYVHVIGQDMARESPIIVPEFSREKKPGTIHIDYNQNSSGKTMVAPYSLRATVNATVSFPLYWNEVKKGLKPEHFTLSTIAKSESNPWKGMFDERQRL